MDRGSELYPLRRMSGPEYIHRHLDGQHHQRRLRVGLCRQLRLRATGDNADGAAAKTLFDIGNAVNADGTPANLQYIDFVKVQTAINHATALLGEVSTEVLAMADETLR